MDKLGKVSISNPKDQTSYSAPMLEPRYHPTSRGAHRKNDAHSARKG